MTTWQIDLTAPGIGNNTGLVNMTLGQYNEAETRFDSVYAHSRDGNDDKTLDFTMAIPDGTTITKVTVAAYWDREVNQAKSDRAVQIRHTVIGSNNETTETLLAQGQSIGTVSAGSETVTTGEIELTSGTLEFYGWIDSNSPSKSDLRYNSVIIEGEGINPILFVLRDRWLHDIDLAECPICYVSDLFSGNPINLYTGNKVETKTDLAVMHTNEMLSFTRTYVQDKQDKLIDILGAGWTHNHDVYLYEDAINYPNELLLQMPKGGIARFLDDDANDIYEAYAGSTSKIDATGTGNNSYLLSNSDGSTWHFDANKQLRQIVDANQETLTYAYYGDDVADPTEFNGKLKAVETAYNRSLTFAYYPQSTIDAFKRGVLRYVGDQTVANILTPQSGERVVEFDYVEMLIEDNGNLGTFIGNGDALLTSVTDVRNNTWQYRYYGQTTGETDLDQLNLLVAHQAPDGIDIFQLDYVLSNDPDFPLASVQQRRGVEGTTALETVNYEFQADDENKTIETEVDSQYTITHYYNGGVYLGTEDADTNLARQDQGFTSGYRVRAVEDKNDNLTLMDWSSDSKRLERVTDAASNQTSFAYDSQDRLTSSTDAEGGITEYIYGNTSIPRQPTIIKVKDTDGTTLLRQQEFVYDSKGRTTSEKLIDPTDGITILQETARVYGTSGNGNGLLESIEIKDLLDSSNDSSTVYSYDAQGRVIRTQKTSMFGTCEFNHTVYDVAGNVLGTACGLVSATPIPSDEASLLALYDANDSDKKHTRITTHDYDEMGRRVVTTSNAGTSWARTNRTIYDALSRVTRTIQNYVDETAAQVAYSAPGTWSWDGTKWVDDAGVPIEIEHGDTLDENIISDTEYNGRGLVNLRRDVLGRVTLYGYNTADRLVKTVQNASDVAYDMSYATGEPDLSTYSPSNAVDEDIITEQVYDPNGNVVKSIDARGSVTFTALDALNRPVKVISNVAQPDYDILADLSLENYGSYSTDPDKDMVSTTEYGAMGRVVQSKRLLENRGASEEWDTTYYVYDSLGRQVRTIQHYVPTSPEILPDLWVWDTDKWKDEADGNAIDHGDNDSNLITETVYDNQGRVKETLDVNRRVNRMVYDGLNRQVMTVANYVEQGDPVIEPDNWEWSDSNNQWEHSPNNKVLHGDNDQNIISQTVYDSDGRVESTRNVQGLVSRNAYDGVGRSLLRVQNYVEQATTPDNWDWTSDEWQDGGSVTIARGDNYDQNIISKPEYDDEQRVFQTRDARGNLSRQVYDEAGRTVMSIANYVEQANPPEDWVWENGQWKDSSNGTQIDHGMDKDQNRISTSEFDLLGRAFRTGDAKGRESYTVYDALGRVVRRIQNYVEQGTSIPDDWYWSDTNSRWEYDDNGTLTAIDHGTDNDQNIISETVYNQAGQVVSSRDAFGTESSFVYDSAGRRLQVIQASNTDLATTSYTCFDKAGRVLRSIANYKDTGASPDVWDIDGNWAFQADNHGMYRDSNIISEMVYDRASRRVSSVNAVGDVSQTTYFKDGQVDSMTDPEGMVTVYRYDALRRRKMVVQSYVEQGSPVVDPANWAWGGNQYKADGVNDIAHGTNQDQNIIVMIDYDIAGRMETMRDPRGNLTSYTYDKLGRRTRLDNPLPNIHWDTSYTEVDGAQETTMTYPGINGGTSYDVVREFDRFGRLQGIDYNDDSNTAKVNFDYDILGNRLSMSENDGTSDIRITGYSYDQRNRLIEVGVDTDDDGIAEEIVSYDYDMRGLRTKLTMDGNLSIAYSYDAKGRLIGLNDWDNQDSQFNYDALNRHIGTVRPNGMRSVYRLDEVGRLRELRHENKKRQTLAMFRYAVDKRGNRVQAQELTLPANASATAQVISHENPDILYTGNWTDTSSFHESTEWDAKMALVFVGDTNVDLLIGQGPDHSIFDIYVDGTLYESVDGYASVASSRTVSIDLKGDDWHGLEIRNRHEQNMQSSGYTVRFASLSVDTALTATVIDYSYDDIGRLQDAVYADGSRSYSYEYDVAGNRLQEQVMIDNTGTPVITTTNWTYNNANQIATMQVGSNPVSNFQYDANGNLISDGQLAYTWDRANRLTTLNNGSYNTHYAYDGNNNRVQQTIGGIATDYLLDIQPQLALVLKETTPSETLSYVHSPRGVHAVEDNAGDWHFMVSDGLGSVRSQVDDLAVVEASQAYSPYGQVYGVEGTFTGTFGYTGEQVDESGMSYLRARYYDPTQATFASLDPFEGKSCTPMSLNGYAYVHGNPILNTDPTGMMVAGRMLNIDTSGTSRILQSWSNALKGAFTIPSLSLVKSMNSGLCGIDVQQDSNLWINGANQDVQNTSPLAERDCSCWSGGLQGIILETEREKCRNGHPSYSPCNIRRLTEVDWIGAGLVYEYASLWGVGAREAVQYGLDLVYRATVGKTPEQIIHWVTGSTSFNLTIVSVLGSGGTGGRWTGETITLYSANTDDLYNTAAGVKTVVHELAHGVDYSMGDNGEFWSEVDIEGGWQSLSDWDLIESSPDPSLRVWQYNGSENFGMGEGPANNYLTRPTEDFANSFASVVFEINLELGLPPETPVNLDGDINGDGVVGITEIGPINDERRNIIRRSLGHG